MTRTEQQLGEMLANGQLIEPGKHYLITPKADVKFTEQSAQELIEALERFGQCKVALLNPHLHATIEELDKLERLQKQHDELIEAARDLIAWTVLKDSHAIIAGDKWERLRAAVDKNRTTNTTE